VVVRACVRACEICAILSQICRTHRGTGEENFVSLRRRLSRRIVNSDEDR
jgi:hypothetical protein